jgi:hypothetical protein
MERSLLQPTIYSLDRHTVTKNGSHPLRSGQNLSLYLAVTDAIWSPGFKSDNRALYSQTGLI